MGTHIGNDGKVKIGANTVAEVAAFDLSIENAVAEDSQLSDPADSFLAGSYRWSGSLTCWWDETDTNGQVALTPGASVTLNLHPEGDGAGDTYYTGTALVTAIERRVARNQTVEATFRFQGSGALTTTTV